MADPVASAAPAADPGTAPAAAAPAAPAAAASTLLTTAPPAADPANPVAADPTNPAADPAKPPEAAKPAAEPAKPVGAPEKYADFTMPEGVTVDAKALESFSPVLKGLNLSQDQAQQLVTAYATQMQTQATDFAKQLQDPVFATQQAGLMLNGHRDAWATAVKADTEIGGANFDANVQTAQRAVARFGTPELKALLETTGLGNHPALVKMFVAVGKQIREDNPTYGTGGTARKSNAEIFYGGQPAATGA